MDILRTRKRKPASLENIVLDSPEVKDAIERLAKSDWVGKNPILEYIREHLIHAKYHVAEKIFPKKEREHPRIAYYRLEELISKSVEHFRKISARAPYQVRSFLVGKDNLKEERQKQGPIFFGKVSNIAYAARGLKRYLGMVSRNVDRDAKIMRLNDKARKYFRSMEATLDPEMVSRGREISEAFVEGSFSDVKVDGLEEKVNGETVLDLLHGGGVVILQNHPSYTGVPISKDVYGKLGLDSNMYFIAGSNVLDVKAKANSDKLKAMVTGAGAILIRRDFSMKKDSLLYLTLLKEYVGTLLSQGANITLYMGRGRDKGDKEEALNSIITRAIVDKSRYIIPVAESHDVIPDDSELASHQPSKRAASFETMFALKRDDKGAAYGKVYLTFGKPVQPTEYAGLNKRNAQDDITRRIRGLVNVTPTYLLARVVKDNALDSFGIDDAIRPAEEILDYANAKGLNVSPELKGPLPEVLQGAADKLVSRGALRKGYASEYGFGRHEEPMLAFYAAKTEGILKNG
ncbi:hypothetical protein JXB11_02720 [Candidatus Woesearchaeota archaeon]|nr:hypothetical protein [Candidatus Woesearchaeota archaeon]